MSRLMWQLPLVAGALSTLLACSHVEPVADLSRGQDGKIWFQSENRASFKDSYGGGNSAKPVNIVGTLALPRNSAPKVPAAIVLHGGSGLADHYFRAARQLNELGLATFVVDSYGPRGIQGLGDRSAKINYSMRVSDAYAALRLLSSHPRIDRERIVLVGYSAGGQLALLAASEKVRHSFNGDDLRFAAHVLYYPGCFFQLEHPSPTVMLMLLGGADNAVPAKVCTDYEARLRAAGADVASIVYEGAEHGFDILELSGKSMLFPGLTDYSTCGDRVATLQDDGTWLVPALGRKFEEFPDRQELFSGCAQPDKGRIGDPTNVRARAENDLKAFLKRVLKLT